MQKATLRSRRPMGGFCLRRFLSVRVFAVIIGSQLEQLGFLSGDSVPFFVVIGQLLSKDHKNCKDFFPGYFLF